MGALWYFDGRRTQITYIPPHAPLAIAVDATGNPWFTAASVHQPSRIIEALPSVGSTPDQPKT